VYPDEELLQQMQALRMQIEHERSERMEQDERIRTYLLEQTEAMQQAILETFPDPTFLDDDDY
jgi:hypothetical protein